MVALKPSSTASTDAAAEHRVSSVRVWGGPQTSSAFEDCRLVGVGVDDTVYSRDFSWSTGGDHMFSNQNLQPGTEFGSNKGCHIGTMDVGLCAHAGIIWLMMIITLAASITGSVMGCCVVCCGNDVDKSDDSG